MIQTARYTGLRLGETCGLTWGQVDLDRNVLVIDRQFGKDDRIAETKSGKVREVPIFPTLRKVLVERKLAAGAVLPSAPVFPNRDGDFRSQGIVDRAFRKVRDRANLSVEPRGIRFHDLRHSYCSRLVAGGTPIATVQKWAGHASPATTYKYLHHVEAEGTYDLAAAACGAAL
jgi:integrase